MKSGGYPQMKRAPLFLRGFVAVLWFSLGVLLIPLALWLANPSREGHTGPIADIAFSPRSNEIVTIGADGQRFWDAATGKELARKREHVSSAARVLATLDGRRFVLSDDRRIKIGNRTTRKVFCALDLNNPKECMELEPKALALSRNDDKVKVYAMEESRLLNWDTDTGQPGKPLRWTAPLIQWYVSSIQQRAATFSDGRVTLHQMESVAGRTEPVPITSYQATAFAAARDKFLISNAEGTTIRDLDTGKIRRTIGHAKSALAIGVSPDEQYVAILEPDGELEIIELDTGKRIKQVQLPMERFEKDRLASLELLPEKVIVHGLKKEDSGRHQKFQVVLNYESGAQTRWETDLFEAVARPMPETDFPTDVLAHDMARNVYFQLEVLDGKYRVRRFNAITREPTGKKIELSARFQDQLQQERLRQEEAYLALGTPSRETTTPPLRLVSAISPDGARLAVAVKDTIYILDAFTGIERERKRVPVSKDESISSLMFTRDGEIAITDTGSRMYLYNELTEQMVLLGEFLVEPGTLLAIDNGEQVLVRRKNSFWIANAENGDHLRDLKMEDEIGDIQEARFSHSGNRVIARVDDEFRLWDARTGEEIKETRGLDSIDTTAMSQWALSPNGHRVAVAYDSMVSIRDVKTGEILRKIKPPHAEDGVSALEYTPDGDSLLLTSGTRWQLWDLTSEYGEPRLESAIPFWYLEAWGWPVLFWWLFLVFVVFFFPTLNWFARGKKIRFTSNPYLELFERPGIDRYLPG